MTKVLTTTIGSFPKPDYLPVRDWFHLPYSPTFDAFYFDNRDLRRTEPFCSSTARTGRPSSPGDR